MSPLYKMCVFCLLFSGVSKGRGEKDHNLQRGMIVESVMPFVLSGRDVTRVAGRR